MPRSVTTLVEDDNFNIVGDEVIETEAANGFGNFSTELFLASQTSSLTFNSLNASAAVRGFGSMISGEPGGRLGNGSANFEVTFDLSEPTTYSLDFADGGFIELGNFSILGPSPNIDEALGISNDSEGFNLSQSGLLDAGTYTIELSIGRTDSSELSFPDGTFDLDFQIAAAPEPSSSFAFFATVLLAATKRRRV